MIWESYGPLPKDLRGMFFQAVRELLFNGIKHSGAKSARVIIRPDETDFRVIVEDTGKGFDPSQLDIPCPEAGGFGLFNIRRRPGD